MNVKTPKLVGILNVTPDSFSDGGQFFDPEKAIVQAKKMFGEGAYWVDVGGESTRPGAEELTPEQEWNRIKDVLKPLVQNFPNKISLDTKNWRTAHKFLRLGGNIINDVSGGCDPRMAETVASVNGKIILNHFPAWTTKEVHEQKISSMSQVVDDLMMAKEMFVSEGVDPNKIILDPGIGFGKTIELNWKLLKFGAVLPDERIYIGYSKKRFLGADRFEIEPNLTAAKIALENGAEFLRVHDVGEHTEFLSGLA